MCSRRVSYQNTKVPNIRLEIPTATKDHLWSTVEIWLDRINAKLLSYHSILRIQLVKSRCKSEICYFGNQILDISPVKSTEVIMAAVDNPTTLAVNLILYFLLLFYKVGKNAFVFKAYEDVTQLRV